MPRHSEPISILTCNYCGHSGHLSQFDDLWTISCRGCGVSIDGYISKQKAIDCWNKNQIESYAIFLRNTKEETE